VDKDVLIQGLQGIGVKLKLSDPHEDHGELDSDYLITSCYFMRMSVTDKESHVLISVAFPKDRVSIQTRENIRIILDF